MIIKQIRSTDGTATLSYIIADETQKVAVIIDPNLEDIEIYSNLIKNSGFKFTHLIDTHTHADHISAIRQLKELTGAEAIMHSESKDKYKLVDQGDAFGIGDTLRENVKVTIDRLVNDGDVITVGSIDITVMYSPGHTNDHICLLAGNNLFTGDLLLIGQAGRSDLPGGSADDQYDTLFNKILKLPDETIIHPAHDYSGYEYSTLAEEKKTNPFLKPRSKEEYKEFVGEFFPPIADSGDGKMILQCGVQRVSESNGYINISPEELKRMQQTEKDLTIIDVREPIELQRFGKIDNIINIPMRNLIYGGADLGAYEDKKIIIVCQTGSRSAEAAHFLVTKGFEHVYNLLGGTKAYLKPKASAVSL
jgi:sulfur dioxygenase